MIQYLKIRNFGPIKNEIEINFEAVEQMEPDAYEVGMPDGRKLLKLAYIYGANGSGKTTVLKAFEFLRNLLLNPINNKTGELNYEPFLFCEAPYTEPSFFEMAFYADGIRYIYELNFAKHSILNEKMVFYHSAKPTELYSRITNAEKRLTKIQFGSKIKIPVREKDLLESNTLHNNTVFGAYAKTNVDIPELEKLNKWFSTFLLGMVTSTMGLTELTASQIETNPGVNKWINSYLNKADKQIKEVNVQGFANRIGLPSDETKYGGPDPRKIDFVHDIGDGKKYIVPILKEGNGMIRYFGLGGPLYELIHGQCMLCIDDLETSLHPDLMKFFLQMFLMNASASQMLITTHNVALMEHLDFIRKDALWFCEKENNGAVNVYSAADFDSTSYERTPV
ncbi:MAG TPA: AAA family ATPase [Patescibacteria group bacterium]